MRGCVGEGGERSKKYGQHSAGNREGIDVERKDKQKAKKKAWGMVLVDLMSSDSVTKEKGTRGKGYNCSEGKEEQWKKSEKKRAGKERASRSKAKNR